MIHSPLLPHHASYIDGKWRTEPTEETIAVRNPASGDLLAEIPSVGAAHTEQAVEAGIAAMRRAWSFDDRRNWLTAIAAAMESHRAELGRIITFEQGKPLNEGIAEVEYAASYFTYFSQQLDELRPQSLDGEIRNCRWTVRYRPAGVAGIITPWNFPLAMLTKKLGAAIGAGCAVVAKPSELTPLSAVALWTLIDRLGLPRGLLNLLIGEPRPIAAVLSEHPAVRILSFTGSTEVGRILIRETAKYVKRLALELGGNAPFVIFSDADVPLAVESLMANKFRAGGQTCVCANRVYVHKNIADEFTASLAERIRSLRVGDGMLEGTDIGPLINRDAFDKVARHVQDAIDKGARRVVGRDPDRPAHDWGCYYPATLLTGIRPEMEVCREETFGPVVSLTEFESDDSVIEACNSTLYGLAAYLFTRDADRARLVIEKLEFGHVAWNSGTGPAAHAPFGGMKQSGFGREGGREGLLEFCEPQTLAAAVTSKAP